MWVAATVGGIFAAALVPTIAVYGPELFPTSLRGRANGIVTTVGHGGQRRRACCRPGTWRTRSGSFGRALGILAAGPLVMAAVILLGSRRPPAASWRTSTPRTVLAPEGARPPAPAHASL